MSKDVRIKECCGLGWLALWVFLLLFAAYSMDKSIARLARSLETLVEKQTVLMEKIVEREAGEETEEGLNFELLKNVR